MANRRVRRRFSEDEMSRGIGMLKAGRSQRHVAHVLRVSQSVVSRMWNRFQTTGTVLQSKGRGSGTFKDSCPGPIYCSPGQAPKVPERYGLR